MERQTILPAGEAAWLELRKSDITSTMISALFDLSPYYTLFELYHAKRSGLDLPFDENDRTQKGGRLQDYAADEVALKHGWKIRRMSEYIRIPEVGMGASFDYEVICPTRGKGILEIKGVDYFRHKDLWINDESPEHIEIQLQHQLEVADTHQWGMIAAFTSIYDWHEYERDRDRDFGAALVAKAKAFWADVAAGNEPSPDFYRDADCIKALHKGGPPLNAVENADLNMLFSRYERLSQEKKAAEDDCKATQAEIIRKMGNHSEAFGERYKFKITQIKEIQPTEVTESMVGTFIGGRSGYPKCTISDLMKKKGGG